jgi:hypothetical protein
MAIPQQESWCCLFREGFNGLLCGPQSSRMGRRIEVDYLSPVVMKHNEAVQNIESHSRYGEEINGYNLICMIPQKALPRL